MKNLSVFLVILVAALALAADDGTIARTVDVPAAAQTASTTTTVATSPAASKVTYGQLQVGPGGVPYYVDPAGTVTLMLPLGAQGRCSASAVASGTAPTYGLNNGTGYGTVASGALANTSLVSSVARTTMTTAAGANSAAGVYSSIDQELWRGNAAGLGGFVTTIRAGVVGAGGSTNSRYFFGWRDAATQISGGTDPSSLLDLFGIGCDAADSNFQVMHNDGTGAATKVDLGSDFPCRTANTFYEIIFHAPPNGSSIGYWIRRRDSAATASGTLSTNLPTNTVFMSFVIHTDSGAAGGAGTTWVGPICYWLP